MLQSLRNRRNRKGFTLAELLIVVAIIAVLVAIAVPLFVGALNDAETNVKNANIRAVRAAAVEEILMNKNKTTNDLLMSGDTPYVYWTAKAEVTKDGGISELEITPATSLPTKADTDTCAENADTKGYTVTVYITELTVKK